VKIFISGGIGDFIAFEPFITLAEKNQCSEIVYAARGAYGIKQIVEHYNVFPNLKKSTTIFNDWTKLFSIRSIEHLIAENDHLKLGLNLENIRECRDFSIAHIFGQIASGQRKLAETDLFHMPNKNVTIPELPQDFGVINPYSPNMTHGGLRGFSKKEWSNVLNNVKTLAIPFVVINYSNDYIPESQLLINLNCKTTMPQAIEIAKKASWYIGVDSWLSTFMPKILPPERMVIKTINYHFVQNIAIYMSPHIEFGSVHCGLEQFKFTKQLKRFLY